MLLNHIEKALMNNPIRVLSQRLFEAPRFLNMASVHPAGVALEIGCGRGAGVEIILELFGATHVDAFDLDPRMIAQARRRLAKHGERVRLWSGDAIKISAPDRSYDSVFDFGILHHVPDWREGLKEVHRVLKPQGRFYAEEVLQPFITHPLWRRVLEHPQEERFDHAIFQDALAGCGFDVIASKRLGKSFAWFVADKQC